MTRRDRIVVYRDGDGDWRWRFVASNGKIMADSAEGYRRRTACVTAATRVCASGHHGVEWV